MRDINDLEEYIENTGDAELGMMVEIVKEYRDEIPNMLKTLKEKHIADNEKETAEMIFSTVHRCKGMEYDCVLVAPDFLNEEGLEKMLKEKKGEISLPKLREEINLLYVAVTRAKNRLHMPESLMPKNFPSSTQIHVYKVIKEEAKNSEAGTINSAVRQIIKSESFYEKARTKNKDAYRPWTRELDDELTAMYYEGVNIKELAEHFGRTKGAIWSRIKKLELRDLYE